MPSALWIAWQNHMRNQTLSKRLGAELHVFTSKRARLVKYISCASRTVLLIAHRRPSVVFAPNPSIVLTYLLLSLKYVFRFTFVSDAHYAGIIATNGNRLFQKALDFGNRFSDFVVVTNEGHRRHVEAVGGRAVVCEDLLPDIGQYAETVKERPKKVFFICSFDIDEPYIDVFRAAAVLQREGYELCVSGNFSGKRIVPTEWPHVRFIGYVSEKEFYSHLAESEIAIDLTTHENCLLCGAYEAMVLDKPLVTSKTAALQAYFTAGTVFVDHSSESIVNGVKLAYQMRAELKSQIKEWKKQIIADNATKIDAVRTLLNLAHPVPVFSIPSRSSDRCNKSPLD